VPGDTAIAVSGLRKRYGANEAVRGIDFDVRTGEVFGFLGTNGAGKTTTIEILEGYRERTAGDVEVLGIDPAHASREWRDRIGLVLQECELEPTLTVRESLRLFAGFYSAPRPVDETIELVGLGDRPDARVGSLSGGQRRRVDVALGIIGDPELIFLDEPTTGFDPAARRGAWTMIEGLKALGKTVFLTTHYMDEAQHLADRVAILRAGEIVGLGAPDELIAHDTGRTTISFVLPAGTSAAELSGVLGAPLDAEGVVVVTRPERPQQALHALTGWAEERGIELGALEVRRPTLEDVFLELTGPEQAEHDE